MKALLKVLKILCYVCSFPIFMVCAIVASKTVIATGGSYGFGSYAGVIVAVVFSVIWAVLVLVFELRIKKNTKNKRKKIKRQTVTMAVASFALTAGLFVILDIALPPLLPGPTSGTIYYEDLADAANERAELNKEMLDVVISRCVLNGVIGKQYFSYYKTTEQFGPYTGLPVDKDDNELTLSKYGYHVLKSTYNVGEYEGTQDGQPSAPKPKSVKEIADQKEYFNKQIKKYQDEGMKNEEVQAVMNRDGKYNLFGSLNLSGYESVMGCWIDLANDGRMTIPVVVNLIIGQRPSIVSGSTYGSPSSNEDGTRKLQANLHTMPWYNPATNEIEMVQMGWTVLDMLGDYGTDHYNPAPALGVDLGMSDGLWAMLKNIELAGTTLDNLLGEQSIDNLLEKGLSIASLRIPALYYVVDSLLASVSAATGNPIIAGTPSEGWENNWQIGYAPLTLKLSNADGGTVHKKLSDGTTIYYGNVGDAPSKLNIYPTNYSRGVLDYQRMAWVDSNGLLFIICALLAIRKVAYIFSGVVVILMVVVGFLRLKVLDMETPKTKAAEATPAEQEAPAVTPIEEEASFPNYYEEPTTEFYGPVGNL